jgi:hypothetical membrane protein
MTQSTLGSTTPLVSSNRQRWLLSAGVFAPVLFVLLFTLAGALQPRYSAADEAISYLDLGPTGWLQRANFLLLGIALLGFLWAYLPVMTPRFGTGWRSLIQILLSLSNLGWIMAGLFVPNPYLAPQVEWPAILHQIAVIVVFLPFAIACVVQGIAAFRTPGWRGYGVYSCVLALPLFVFPFGTIAYLINQNVVGNVNSPGSGTMDRVALIVGPLAWYAITAILALRRTPSA